MFVCLCKGVSDKKIRSLVQGGAQSVKEIVVTSRAGSDCGTCLCDVKAVFESCRAQFCSPCQDEPKNKCAESQAG